MRHTAVRFKILVPWMVGMMMACILLVLPIMFGLVSLTYGTSAPRVFDSASKFAVVSIVYSLMFAIIPVFQVNVFPDARDRARYLRENVVAGWWLMQYGNVAGVSFLVLREAVKLVFLLIGGVIMALIFIGLLLSSLTTESRKDDKEDSWLDKIYG